MALILKLRRIVCKNLLAQAGIGSPIDSSEVFGSTSVDSILKKTRGFSVNTSKLALLWMMAFFG